MRFDEYRAHDAVGLAELVATGQVSASELLSVALTRCDEVDPALNFLSLRMEEAGRATAADPATGPFSGVPFLIKDLKQDYAGYPTSAGTGPLREVPAEVHSEVVRRWLAAGLVIFGKTTTPEFGTKANTETRAFGATRNPWDLARTPGGSSGGSAAAVAAGVVPVAGASDGGGSIRIPAACTGLFGFKAGRGLLPCGPDHGEYLHGAATSGVLSRSVRDSAAMLDVLAVPDPGAPFLVARPDRPYAEAATEPPPPLRIGFITESPYGTPVHAEAVAAVHDAAELLTTLGHHVEAADFDVRDVHRVEDFTLVWCAHAAAVVGEARRRTGAPDSAFDFDTRMLAEVGRATSAAEFVRAHERWNLLTRRLADFHTRYDLLLTPTLAAPPQRIGENRTPPVVERLTTPLIRFGVGRLAHRTRLYWETVTANLAAVPFTQLANLTGRPAMSVPTYATPDGLPLGVQFVGPSGGEITLLQLAAQLETARPWAHRHPPEPIG